MEKEGKIQQSIEISKTPENPKLVDIIEQKTTTSEMKNQLDRLITTE